MSFFKKERLEGFISNSKSRLEKDLQDINLDFIKFESRKTPPSLIDKLIRCLSIYTEEGKILWHKENKRLIRGIVVKNCIFSDYKIFLEIVNKEKKLFFSNKEKFKISLIKGILTAERIEYISNLDENYDEITALLSTIEQKFQQEKN